MDLSRFDRQIRTFGKEASNKIASSCVYVVGLNGGLGTELVRNLVLSGVNEIHLIDNDNISKQDIEYSYYFNENDIDKPRAKTLKSYVTNLNPTTHIYDHSCHILDLTIKLNSTIVLLNTNLDEATNINRVFRNSKCKTIYCHSRGVCGFVFVDMMEHDVLDIDGNTYENLQIENISNKGIVYCTNHYLQVGDKITFTNIDGTDTEFLESEWKVNSVSKNQFTIVSYEFHAFPIRSFTFKNGTLVYLRTPVTFHHKSLEDQLESKKIIGFDPDTSNQIIDSILETNIDYKRYNDIKMMSGLELAPVNSILAGIASNEVIKSITNKYTPISQWYTYSDFDILPNKNIGTSGTTFSKYYGEVLEKEIKKLNVLMVGCGALGCEWLKNLAQMGACTTGTLEVTDPDHIETSNLSRQFLFNNSDVKKSKSNTAKNKIQKVYPNMNINAYEQKVCDTNEDFVRKLFDGKDIVINALDNIEARKYVDNQCLNHCLPLFESGTMGMKGNTQPVIPFLTETYSNSSDPNQEKEYPVCTIKNFPNQIHHTIHWARDNFENFNRAPKNINAYKENKMFLDSLPLIDKNQAIKDLNDYLLTHISKTWQDCCNWAIELFLEEFNHTILQLLHCFPKNHMIDDKLFWSNGKRCPKPLILKSSDPNILKFVFSTTKILTNCNNITDKFTIEDVSNYIDSYKIKNSFVPKDMNIAKNDEELKEQKQENDEIEINFDTSIEIHDVTPQDFEKDDDTNYHVMWITYASNCRALNYGIPVSDEYTTKGIAGKIIPAVLTTTSTIVGFIAMELLKYVKNNTYTNKDVIENYSSWFVNMADNSFISADPIEASINKVGPFEFNCWDKLEYTENNSLKEFLEYYENKFNTKISMILKDTTILYCNFMNNDTNIKLDKLVVSKISNYNNESLNLILASEDDNLELPTITLRL